MLWTCLLYVLLTGAIWKLSSFDMTRQILQTFKFQIRPILSQLVRILQQLANLARKEKPHVTSGIRQEGCQSYWRKGQKNARHLDNLDNLDNWPGKRILHAWPTVIIAHRAQRQIFYRNVCELTLQNWGPHSKPTTSGQRFGLVWCIGV